MGLKEDMLEGAIENLKIVTEENDMLSFPFALGDYLHSRQKLIIAYNQTLPEWIKSEERIKRLKTLKKRYDDRVAEITQRLNYLPFTNKQ